MTVTPRSCTAGTGLRARTAREIALARGVHDRQDLTPVITEVHLGTVAGLNLES